MNLVAEHRLRNEPSEVRQIGDWVADFARRATLSKELQNAFDLSLVEWITNIISYAYDDSREHWITIRFHAGGAEVRVEVEDDGREFNPINHPPVDTAAPLEARPVGGLGIHMMRQFMDGVEYQRVAGRNVLTMKKRRA